MMAPSSPAGPCGLEASSGYEAWNHQQGTWVSSPPESAVAKDAPPARGQVGGWRAGRVHTRPVPTTTLVSIAQDSQDSQDSPSQAWPCTEGRPGVMAGYGWVWVSLPILGACPIAPSPGVLASSAGLASGGRLASPARDPSPLCCPAYCMSLAPGPPAS